MDEAEYCNRIALMHGGKMIALGSPSQLKKSLGDGHLFHVESSDLLGSMTIIQGLPDVLDVAVFGAGLHVKSSQPTGMMEAISAALTQRGIEIRALEPIEPSMEDVFVGLIEREERAAA